MDWIDSQIAALEASSSRARDEFAHLNAEQADRKPAPKSWSVNECLDHLIQANGQYVPLLESIAAGTPPMGYPIPFIPRWLGRIVLNAVRPETKRRVPTSAVFEPSASSFGRNLVADFSASNEAVIDLLGDCREVDLDGVVVASPVSRLVTYSVRDCISIVVLHQERHLNQAARVVEAFADRP